MRNRRAALAAVASAASLALALTGCGQNGGGGGEGDKGGADGATIGIAMPTKSSERWIADGANVERELKAKGYKTRLVYGEDDPDQQVSQIENMITQGVRALIVAAIDNKSLDNVMRQAKDAGVLLVIDSDAHGPDTLVNTRWGVATARRAWLGPDDVANTRPWAELRKLRKGGR